jgi:hypothetical protein
MTLATHIIIASAITKPIVYSNPLLAFAIGLASHYLSDAIPHWDYRLSSLPEKEADKDRVWNFKKSFRKDIFRIGTDIALGLAVSLLFFNPGEALFYFLLTALASILPDMLQGVFFTKRAGFLKPLQIFHDRMHSRIKLGPYPIIGLPFQMAIALLFLLV